MMDENIKNPVEPIGTNPNYIHTILWKNVVALIILHILACWGWYIMIFGDVTWKTIMWGQFIGYFSAVCVATGAHKFYSHRSFKAHPIVRALFMLGQTIAGQQSMYTWCRNHRLHHRFSDTDGDPTNATRGFFYSHIGWIMTKRHPLAIEHGRKINMSDLNADWMVMFQKKYYFSLFMIFSVLIPVFVSVQCFGDTVWNAFLVGFLARYVQELHGSFCGNSFAHLYGTRPYDKNIKSVDSMFVSLITLGEGCHNYHHTFPWDYSADLHPYSRASILLIRLFALMGLVYDLKTCTSEMVTKRVFRTGDGTHAELGNDEDRAAMTAFGPLHPLNPTYRKKAK